MTFEIKDLIGLWGAILSTALGCVALISKLSRVKFYYETEWIQDADLKIDLPYVTVSIANVGEKIIVIRKIIMDRYVSTDNIVPKNEDINYSEKLSQGEQYKYKMALS